MAKTKTPDAPTPLRSGWCNVSHPLGSWQHERCSGALQDHPCPCPCHTPADTQETSMSNNDGPERYGAPVPPDLTHSEAEVWAQGYQAAAAPEPKDGYQAAVQLVTDAAHHLNTALAGTALADGGVDGALRLLHQLRDAISELRQLDAAVVQHVYLTAEHGVTTVEGLGRVEVGRTRDRKAWDERGVLRALVDGMVEANGGEAPDPWDVVERILEAHRFDEFRVTALRAQGLDPKHFCTDVPGNPVVRL